MIVSVVGTAFGQHKKSEISANFLDASAYMYEKRFEEAIPLLKICEEIQPTNANVLYKLGLCYLNSRALKTYAETYLERAAKDVTDNYKDFNLKVKQAPSEVLYYLGIAYRLNYKFDESLQTFNRLKSSIGEVDAKDTAYVHEIDRQIEITNNAVRAVANPVEAHMTLIGDAVNSAFSDHSPQLSIDGQSLIFSSRRPHNENATEPDDEDIFIAKKENGEWQKPTRLGSAVNTKEHEAPTCLSVDGKNMYIFRSKSFYAGKLHVSKSSDGQNWGETSLLKMGINSPDRNTHATLSPDENSVYFVSNRPNPEVKDYNRTDLNIWVVHRMPDGDWSVPKMLPDNINTVYDEETPYIHPDGVTMFFSSKGHNTMGGYDVFRTIISKNGTYTDPVNLGYPINSTDDDVSYSINFMGDRGYMASAKKDGIGDLDIYEIFQKGVYESNRLALRGNIVSTSNDSLHASVIYRNSDTGEKLGTSKNNSKGDYLIVVPRDIDAVDVDFVDERHLSEHIAGLKIADLQHDKSCLLIPEVKMRICEGTQTIAFANNNTELTPKHRYYLDEIVQVNSDVLQRNDKLSVHITFKTHSDDPEVDRQRLANATTYLADNAIDRKNIYTDDDAPNLKGKVYILYIDEYEEAIAVEPPLAAVKTVVIYDIMFDFDKSDIRKEYRSNLDILTAFMRDNPETVVEVGGHTDSKGTDAYNMQLSSNRAVSVKRYLVSHGVPAERVQIAKFGERAKIVDDMEGGEYVPDKAQYNRRAEFRMVVPATAANLLINNVLGEAKTGSSVTTVDEGVPVSAEAAASAGASGKDEGEFIPQGASANAGKFTVQIAASTTKMPAATFASYGDVKEHFLGGWYRYYVGVYNTRRAAQEAIRGIKPINNSAPFIRRLDFFE